MKQPAIDTAWRGVARCDACAIRHLALFSDLAHEDFHRIHLPIDEFSLERGQALYHRGDTVASVFTVRSGLIKLVQHLPNGDFRIVRVLRQGDVAGLERLNDRPAEHDAIAMDRVELCRIPLGVVQTLRDDTPRLHRQLIERWQRALADADTWLTELSTGPARTRVARLLLHFEAAAGGADFFLPTREDMGAMLGITTESTSKVTAEFKRQGWLQSAEGPFVRIDRAALSQLTVR
ncbi:MAG: Crp/Fnr family transcriptional regulator [Gammaproteobacteria bacterium]|nr:Crp/Fnr family transcriptional regulator [Gammaproteobacteria bacterium]MCP5138142.1 Crp/Fnr family transcriptional regulator [Gammaproteobacteria bacterium]